MKEETDKLYDMITAQIRQALPKFEGAITAEESVKEQLSTYEKLTIADTGRYIFRDGTDLDTKLAEFA